MASMWRKAMLYLGLGPDEEYDDYEIADERHVSPRPAPRLIRRAPLARGVHRRQADQRQRIVTDQ